MLDFKSLTSLVTGESEAVFLFQSDYIRLVVWWCGDGDGISARMLEINWIFDSWSDITSD